MGSADESWGIRRSRLRSQVSRRSELSDEGRFGIGGRRKAKAVETIYGTIGLAQVQAQRVGVRSVRFQGCSAWEPYRDIRRNGVEDGEWGICMNDWRILVEVFQSLQNFSNGCVM